MTDADLDIINRLIDILDRSPVLTEDERREKHRVFREKAVERMLLLGETFGQATGAHDFYHQPEDQFKKHLANTDNDIREQAKVLGTDFLNYMRNGEIPAPYFAWRLAVILSKARHKETERKFLNSWCRHFQQFSGSGARFKAIADRAAKLNAQSS